MEVLLMTGAVARMIDRSEQAVRLYAETGKLPMIKTANGRRLFKKSDVESFLKRQREKGA